MAADARSGYDERIVAERVGGTQAGWGAGGLRVGVAWVRAEV